MLPRDNLNASLDVYPEERALLSDALIAGAVSDQEYWEGLAMLDDEASRSLVRESVDCALSGLEPSIEEELPPDPDIDARLDAYIARQFPPTKFENKETA